GEGGAGQAEGGGEDGAGGGGPPAGGGGGGVAWGGVAGDPVSRYERRGGGAERRPAVPHQLRGEWPVGRNRARHAVEPVCAARRGGPVGGVAREGTGAAHPGALVGDRGTHREALPERHRFRYGHEPAVGIEIGRNRDIRLLRCHKPCMLLREPGERA